jgi:hypothetical protein
MFATQLAGSASSARLCAHRQLSQLRPPRSGLPLTRRGARCFATQQSGPEEQSTAGHTEDAYRTATIRLKELLKDASWWVNVGCDQPLSHAVRVLSSAALPTQLAACLLPAHSITVLKLTLYWWQGATRNAAEHARGVAR